MKTIEQINTEIAKLNREAENYSIIAKYCGVKIAKELKKIPFFDSGYSMGGYFMFLTPNDEGFGKDNNCKEYACSCKYSATHGNVKAKFKTKKDMKMFFTKLARMQNLKYIGCMSADEYMILTNEHRNYILTYEDVKNNIADLFNLLEINGLKSANDIYYYFERGIFNTLIK